MQVLIHGKFDFKSDVKAIFMRFTEHRHMIKGFNTPPKSSPCGIFCPCLKMTNIRTNMKNFA